MMEEQLELNMDKEYLIIQSNSLIMANYDMSAMEQKLFLILVATIRKDDKEINTTSFRISDLSSMMGITSQVLYRDLPKICKSLMSKIVEIKKENKDWDIFNIIKYSKYRGKEGLVTFEINEKAKPYLLELKEWFSIIQLNQVLGLDSKYSLRIYQQAKSNIYLKKYDITIDALKECLKLTQKSYNLFSNIKAKVLLPAINEINLKTDINIKMTEIKVGKKVHAIRFDVSKKYDDKQKVIVKSKNKNGFNNFEGRRYSQQEFDSLEKKLLGWED